MEKFLGAIPSNLRFKKKTYTIDNLVFRLHYRFTVSVLCVAMLLISFTELSGEHIKCVMNDDSGAGEDFMNRYCYLMTTFTVKKYLNSSLLDNGEIPHAGVGPIDGGVMKEEEVVRHSYYQWVFYFFMFQCILFYMPHMIWKSQEAGRIRALTHGLRNAVYATNEAEDREVGGQNYPAKASVLKQFDIISTYLRNHLKLNRYWGLGLITFEALNLVVLIVVILLTHVFLGYRFLNLGPEVLQEGLDSNIDALDEVFPKMTKCTFRKYGPSGTIIPIDAICVMALNIFNEKTFLFLWFWYLMLFIVTASCLIWRFLSMCFYRRSPRLNKFVFSGQNSNLDIGQLLAVTHSYSYLDWLFLVYLSKNMGELVFKDFFQNYAQEQFMLIDIGRNSIEDNTLLKEKSYYMGEEEDNKSKLL